MNNNDDNKNNNNIIIADDINNNSYTLDDMINSNMKWKIHKFGGTSVASSECFKRCASIIEDQILGLK